MSPMNKGELKKLKWTEKVAIIAILRFSIEIFKKLIQNRNWIIALTTKLLLNLGLHRVASKIKFDMSEAVFYNLYLKKS